MTSTEIKETEESTAAEKSAENNTGEKKTGIAKDSLLYQLLDFGKTFLISLAVVFVMVNVFARPIRVQGVSMFPTLQNGSLGFANVYGVKFGEPKRFDIAIIYLKDRKEYLVKRVIGLPGETVEYRDGQLYVNGEMLAEYFLETPYRKNWQGQFMEDVAPVTLGDGEYFCLGDNRPASRDSRYYGAFQEDQIIAKGAFIFFPFDEFGVKSW